MSSSESPSNDASTRQLPTEKERLRERLNQGGLIQDWLTQGLPIQDCQIQLHGVGPQQFNIQAFIQAVQQFAAELFPIGSSEPTSTSDTSEPDLPILNDRLGVWPLRLEIYDCLTSTSDRLRERLEQGAASGTVVLALAQTQGRGQQGRSWSSAPGGLYLSWGLRLDLAATEGARLSLGSAWGLARCFQQLGIPVELKWPNDLLLHRKKLGGLLTETRLRGGRIYQALIGVGLNWSNSPPSPGISLQPVLNEQASPRISSLEGLIALVWLGLWVGCDRWCTSSIPLKNLIEDYENLVKVSGRSVQIGTEWGTITGIATTGELKVRYRSQERLFPPGAISLGYD